MTKINRERVEEIYDRLPVLVVDLDPNPVERGPDYLQATISKVRGHLNEVSVYLQEVMRVKASLESEYEMANASYQVASADLMANDDRVSRLPAVQDRVAMINVILNEDYEQLLKKKAAFTDINHVEKAIVHRRRELENTLSALKLQVSLFRSDIRTGAFYGDEHPKGRGDKWSDPAADALGSDDIEQLMAEAEVELKEEVKSEASKKKKSAPFVKSFDDLGDDADLLLCSECGEPLIDGEDGSLTCKNGHGGGLTPEPEDLDSESGLESKSEEKPELNEEEDPDVTAFLNEEDDFSDVLDGLGN